MNYQDLFDNTEPYKFIKSVRSEETSAKISAKLKGRTIKPEAAAAVGAALRGRKHSPEVCAKRKVAVQKVAEERRQGIRPPAKGGPTRAVVTPLGSFESVKAATAAHGWKHNGSLFYAMKKLPEQYYYVKKGE